MTNQNAMIDRNELNLSDDIAYTANTFTMEVPDKIVVSVGEAGNVKYGRGGNGRNNDDAMFDIGQIPSTEPVALTTPPRVLTVIDRNMDLGEDYTVNETLEADDNLMETQSSATSQHSNHNPMMETSLMSASELPGSVDDVTVLRRQVFKLYRRITLLERNQAEQTKKEKYVYAIGAVLCALNAWFFYKNRRWL